MDTDYCFVFCQLFYRLLSLTHLVPKPQCLSIGFITKLVLLQQLLTRYAKWSYKNPSWKTTTKIMLETKLPIIFVKNVESGNDGSLLKINEKELWVGNGYLSNQGETKGRSDFMNHKDVQAPFCFSPQSFQNKRKENVVGKKMSVLASLDFESRIAMHQPFLRAFKNTLKACSSILPA